MSKNLLDYALDYAAQDIPVFPCREGSKEPACPNGYKDATTKPERIRELWAENPNFNIGTPPDAWGAFVVDVDVKKTGGCAAWAKLCADHGWTTDTYTNATPSGGRHIFYSGKGATSAGKLAPGIDTRGEGGYVLLPPSVVDGRTYRPLNSLDLAPLPDDLKAALAPKTAAVAAPDGVELDTPAMIKRGIEHIERDLRLNGPVIIGNLTDNRCYKLAAAMRSDGLSNETILELLREHWAPDDFDDEWLEAKIMSADRNAQNERGATAIAPNFPADAVAMLTEKTGAPASEATKMATIAGKLAVTVSNAMPCSQDAFALQLIERYGDRLRYVEKWNRWLAFSGARWAECSRFEVWDLLRPIVRDAIGGLTDATRRALSAKSSIAGAESLARGSVLMKPEQFDADPWLLNTPGGVIDLRTGELRPATALDYCTKSTAVAPADAGVPCPLWQRFLDRVTGGDAELAAFLRRLAGYALTGATTEHAMFFLYGTGGNGKGVFVNTLTAIWCDYAAVAPIDTFTATKTDRHPTDMAMLRGARLVTAQEVDRGREWAEAKIKSLTGGDPVSARFMHQDFFTYVPAFKLVIAGNYKPRLRIVDEAVKRRYHQLPFTVTIPEADRDTGLAEKLRAEWAAILRWAIDGCLEWQLIGLAPPEAVREATSEYFASQDPIAAWIEERCERDPAARTLRSALHADYATFVSREDASVVIEHAERFYERLEGHGFRQKRLTSGRVFLGLKLKA
jgi:putative DNA primase/helicase